ncbi:MAG TPA: helix-hairpin-helix domain-containing protein [Gallionella sp.]|nr:helix-hairpin-helix domain-containing protein [Gallionella sp.]
MRKHHDTGKLEDIPNIGKSIASDLRSLGILTPQQLATRDPLKTYLALSGTMGQRHDPCVLYTLMAAQHYLQNGEAVSWWKFTEQGKRMLAEAASGKAKQLRS